MQNGFNNKGCCQFHGRNLWIFAIFSSSYYKITSIKTCRYSVNPSDVVSRKTADVIVPTVFDVRDEETHTCKCTFQLSGRRTWYRGCGGCGSLTFLSCEFAPRFLGSVQTTAVLGERQLLPVEDDVRPIVFGELVFVNNSSHSIRRFELDQSEAEAYTRHVFPLYTSLQLHVCTFKHVWFWKWMLPCDVSKVVRGNYDWSGGWEVFGDLTGCDLRRNLFHNNNTWRCNKKTFRNASLEDVINASNTTTHRCVN